MEKKGESRDLHKGGRKMTADIVILSVLAAALFFGIRGMRRPEIRMLRKRRSRAETETESAGQESCPLLL